MRLRIKSSHLLEKSLLFPLKLLLSKNTRNYGSKKIVSTLSMHFLLISPLRSSPKCLLPLFIHRSTLGFLTTKPSRNRLFPKLASINSFSKHSLRHRCSRITWKSDTARKTRWIDSFKWMNLNSSVSLFDICKSMCAIDINPLFVFAIISFLLIF